MVLPWPWYLIELVWMKILCMYVCDGYLTLAKFHFVLVFNEILVITIMIYAN